MALIGGRGEGRGAQALRQGRARWSAIPTCSTPGSARRCGRSRPWAGPTQTPALEEVLSDLGAGDRLGHPVLLGRPHDDDGHAFHERGAVPHRLPARAGDGREGPEDVEVQGQRHRPPGADRQIRRRCAALHHGLARRRQRRPPAARAGPRRGLAQLRDQAVERHALRRDERRGAAQGLRSGDGEAHGQQVDAGRAGARQRDGRQGARGVPAERGGDGALRVHLGHRLRLVRRAHQADPAGRRRAGEGRDARRHRLRAARDGQAPASGDAVHHRGAVGQARPSRRAWHADRPALAGAGRRPMPRPMPRSAGW